MPLMMNTGKPVAKVAFCGHRGCGKTSLIKQLFTQCEPFSPTADDEIIDKQIYYPGDNCDLFVWEYGTTLFSEQSFPLLLEDQTLYVYVCDTKNVHLDNHIRPFLYSCNSMLNNPHILFVFTADDMRDQTEQQWCLDYINGIGTDGTRGIKSICFVGRPHLGWERSMVYDDRINEIKDIILTHAHEISGAFPLMIPAYENVIRCLSVIDKNMMTLNGFYQLCESMGVTYHENDRALLRYLNRVGFTHFFESGEEPEQINELIIHDMKWLTKAFKAVYAFCHAQHKNVVCAADLKLFLNPDEYPLMVHRFILTLMETYHLAVKVDEETHKFVLKKIVHSLEKKMEKAWQEIITGHGKRKLVEKYQYIYSGINPSDVNELFMGLLSDDIISNGHGIPYLFLERTGVSHGNATAQILCDYTNSCINIEIYAERSDQINQYIDLVQVLLTNIRKVHTLLHTNPVFKIWCVLTLPWQEECPIMGRCKWYSKMVLDRDKYTITCQFKPGKASELQSYLGRSLVTIEENLND